MKIITVLFFSLCISISAMAQSDLSDTVVISGKISKTEILQKDWNASDGKPGEKIYHIYWLEFTLPADSLEMKPTILNLRMPRQLVFKTPSSGLLSELEPYRSLKIKDKVQIKVRLTDLTGLIHNQTPSIPIIDMRKEEPK